MKPRSVRTLWRVGAVCGLALYLPAAPTLSAATHYVSMESANPAPRYTNWATAATNIQQAVDVAVASDAVVVSNGVYAGHVSLTNPVMLLSANGPEYTVIDGGGTNRCVSLADGASLTGFTLSNGYINVGLIHAPVPSALPRGAGGGGVFCSSTNTSLTNCTLTGNLANYGGGACGGTLYNCRLRNNVAADYTVISWSWVRMLGLGGGASESTLYNCTLNGNSSSGSGGGADSCSLYNCILTGNSATNGGGYTPPLGMSGSGYAPGTGGGAASSILNNCTLTDNLADRHGAAFGCALKNSIAYWNTAAEGAMNCDPTCDLDYCCTTPLPTAGIGNLATDPQLASFTHLSANSPCRGAGSADYTIGTDIDGEPWTHPPAIGCDEYLPGLAAGPLTVSLQADYANVAVDYPVNLTALIEGQTCLSVWDFSDSNVAINQPRVTHAWAEPGEYRVALWAFNDALPGGVSATLMVHVVEGAHYVAPDNLDPVFPYTSWATAATNIQDAVDAVTERGATVLVTNGTYATGGRIGGSLNSWMNRVAVDLPLTLRSISGPQFTIIDGGGERRCAYLVSGAVLSGFTLTNGHADSGGGVWCDSLAVVSNCVVAGNSATNGGGAYSGRLFDCALTGNSATYGGGAASSWLYSCALSSNLAREEGGGAMGGSLNNCTLTGNAATYGGGAYLTWLDHCMLTENSALTGGGAGWRCTLNNCMLRGNVASGAGGGAHGSWLNNCTLTQNAAHLEGGGVINCSMKNCIVYFNTAAADANYDPYTSLKYCCTTPLPDDSFGIGNISGAPLFVDFASGNLRPQTNSPCINSGNNACVTGASDLDGNPRIVSGTVDIGAYEYQGAGSVISYAWLQQYSLPTDGTDDYTDSDDDGLNNWQEWVCATCPNNAQSALRLFSPTVTPTNVTLTWQSVPGVNYFLERKSDLAAPFTLLATDLLGSTNTLSYDDTSAAEAGPRLYRVGVNTP